MTTTRRPPPLPFRAHPNARLLARTPPNPTFVKKGPALDVAVTAEWCRIIRLAHERIDGERERLRRAVAVGAALVVLQALVDAVLAQGRAKTDKAQAPLRRLAVDALAVLGVADFEHAGVRLHVVPARTVVASASDTEVTAVAAAASYVRVSLLERAPQSGQLPLPRPSNVVELDARRGKLVAG